MAAEQMVALSITLSSTELKIMDEQEKPDGEKPDGEEWVDEFNPDNFKTSADRSSDIIPLSTGNKEAGSSVTPVDISTGIHKLDVEPISDGILQMCRNLYYRQSMLKDYLSCPQMMLYKWIIGHEEEDTFMAALLGTAGHAVIENMHAEKSVKNFAYTTIDMQTLFVKCAMDALKSSAVPPRISAKFKTITAQMNSVAPEYVQMLQGYAHDKRNQEFYATVCEQLFALAVEFEGHLYLFTGTIDQAGYYQDGAFALRDIKFRANDFKPGPTELNLDMQLSMYAYALKHGVPACPNCKPRYSEEGELTYTGPCESCHAKIGTAAWPNLIAERSELIWMRDYAPRKRDEYTKWLTSDTEFEINPSTGRRRKKRVINDAWVHGYKQGDPSGKAIHASIKSVSFLNVRMADILRVAKLIKDGHFYRKEGSHCNFWCKFRQPCIDMLETQVQELDISDIESRVATVDPFGDL